MPINCTHFWSFWAQPMSLNEQQVHWYARRQCGQLAAWVEAERWQCWEHCWQSRGGRGHFLHLESECLLFKVYTFVRRMGQCFRSVQAEKNHILLKICVWTWAVVCSQDIYPYCERISYFEINIWINSGIFRRKICQSREQKNAQTLWWWWPESTT